MKTTNIKPAEVKRNWYLVDATSMPLGRLASQVASILRGKNKTVYNPSVDLGDAVIVVNAKDIVLTGRKVEQKFYQYHTGYIGGLKEVGYDKILRDEPEKAIYLAVKGMLPKNRIGRKMIKRLKVYAGPEHEHTAQRPVEIKLEGKR